MPLAAYTITKEPVEGRPRKVEYHPCDAPGVDYEVVEKEYRDGRWHTVGTERIETLRISASVGDEVGAEEVYR